MFTDRFIKVPIEMFNKKQAEIYGDDDSATFEGYVKISAMEILSYRPKFNEDHNEENKTVVDFKNGNDIIVLIPINEFENLLNHNF